MSLFSRLMDHIQDEASKSKRVDEMVAPRWLFEAFMDEMKNIMTPEAYSLKFGARIPADNDSLTIQGPLGPTRIEVLK